MKLKEIFIPVFSLCICIAVLWFWTLGFTSFTVFTRTLNQAGELPRDFPELSLEDQDGQVFTLGAESGNYKLVNFVYLNCPDVCHLMNYKVEDIYRSFDEHRVPGELEFYTLSFDLENDDAERLKSYRAQFETEGEMEGWTFGRPRFVSQRDLNKFLYEIGVWTYTLPETNRTNHSLYFFLISPENQIIEVFDPVREEDKSIVQKINSWLSGKKT